MADTAIRTNGSIGGHPAAASAAVPSQLPAAAAPQAGMTEDEIALYDRQIRLWGMRAQEKLRSAHVLLVTARALGNEIAKNLVLAGIGALTIADHEKVTEEDLGSQFLLATPTASEMVPTSATPEQRQTADRAAAAVVVGTNRAAAACQQLSAMNPRVRVVAEESDVGTRPSSYFQQFTLVIVTDRSPAVLNYINTATRLQSRPFYAANLYGFYGFIFADLIEHDFVIVREQGNIATKLGDRETRTRTIVDVQVQADEDGGAGAKETITKREYYSTWYLASDASQLPASIRSVPRRLRNVTPLLPCLRALWEFQEIHVAENYRVPVADNAQDRAEFITLVNAKQQALGTPDVPAQTIREFLQSVESLREISPVATVVGGQLAQDAINTIGHTQQPIQNLVVFDGMNMTSSVYAMHPETELGKGLLATAPNTTLKESTAQATRAALEASLDLNMAAGPSIGAPLLPAAAPAANGAPQQPSANQ